MFDYDSLTVNSYYKGTYVRVPDDLENERNVSHVGKFLGFPGETLLKMLKNPELQDSKIRQVALLCNDEKYGRAIRYFEPETLELVEPTEDQLVVEIVEG
jgi:hypothetical protein